MSQTKTLSESKEYTHWKEASERLGVGYWWFYSRCKDGRLEHRYDHRGQLFISNDSIDNELKERFED